MSEKRGSSRLVSITFYNLYDAQSACSARLCYFFFFVFFFFFLSHPAYSVINPIDLINTFFSMTFVTGPRRSLNLRLSDTRVYEPAIRARLLHLRRDAFLRLTFFPIND